MLSIFYALLGYKRITVEENQRAFHFYKGRFQGILGPGEHLLANSRNQLKVDIYDFRDPRCTPQYHNMLRDEYAHVAESHFIHVQTLSDQIAIAEKNGQILEVIRPDSEGYYWKDAGAWTISHIDISETAQIDGKFLKRLRNAGFYNDLKYIDVPANHTARLKIDESQISYLQPGVYGFWDYGREIAFNLIDLRTRTIEVGGQEILTRDRVSVRVNISATYRVSDPELASSAVTDYEQSLYNGLQQAFRRTLGAMTLDQILEKKTDIDEQSANALRMEMAAIGLELLSIAMKDIILPGEIRDILNQVVAAQKEAEANVIRRREETNATRSLLNTAKVMADNPVMLRLKELESLETISARVDRLTVYNGTQGLLNDLVQIGERGAGEEQG